MDNLNHLEGHHPAGQLSLGAASNPGGPADPPRLMRILTVGIMGIFILALFYTLYFGRVFFMPLTLAILLNFLLKPVIRFFNRLRISNAIAAAIVLLGSLVLLIVGIYLLSEPASRWVANAPQTMQSVEVKVREILKPARKLQEAASQVEKITTGGQQPQTQTVEVKPPSLTGTVLGWTKGFLFAGGEVFVLLYFLLASGDVFLRKLIRVLPGAHERKDAIEIAGKTEKQISGYLFTLALITGSEGALLGIGLWLVGMPNPALWGVMAAFLGFIPYIGFLIGTSIVTLVAFAHFESLSQAMVPPLIYLGINIMDNFLGPLIQGQRLKLNPVVVFVSIVFWGFMWGIPGVLLAVPILMTFKIFCDHVTILAPIGEFISE